MDRARCGSMKRYLAVAIVAGALACSESRAPNAPLVPPPSLPPPPSPPPPPDKSWEAIDLGLLDATSGMALDVGDDGTVVGRLNGPGSAHSGFIYKDGVMRKLPTSGADESPSAIGPSGQIVGTAGYGDTRSIVIWDTPDAAPRRLGGEPQLSTIVGINQRGDVLVTTWLGPSTRWPHYGGVLWRNNVRVDLGDLLSNATASSPSTKANAWNNNGQIVGSSNVTEVLRPHDPPFGVEHPFLWENGVMRDLGVLAPRPCTNVAMPADCSWGVATGINASGVVVGTAGDAEGRSRAFIWENGVMRDLGVAPGHDTWALAINDRGQVLGTVDGDVCHPFFWENGQTQIIAPNGSFCPTGLSPNGEVIGWDMLGGGQHALIWQAGRLIDLGPGEPHAINNRGEVVGWSPGRYASPDCCGYDRPTLWRRRP